MSRKTNAIRQTVAVGLALIVPLAIVAHCTACAKRGSLDDNARRAVNAMTVEQFKTALDECIAEGKDAGSYAVYEACANEADKHFGGSPK